MFIAQSSSSNSGLTNLVVIAVIFGGLFMFMSYRQRKRGRERGNFLSTLQVGDEVRTYGGVVGRIDTLDDEYLVLVSENTRLRLVRAAIAARTEGP